MLTLSVEIGRLLLHSSPRDKPVPPMSSYHEKYVPCHCSGLVGSSSNQEVGHGANELPAHTQIAQLDLPIYLIMV